MADLKQIRIHDLRRTLATFQADGDKANLPTISKSLGHTNVSTTMRYIGVAMGPVRASVSGAVDAILAAKDAEANSAVPAKG